MISDAEQWLRACQNILANDGAEPFQHPHFPGFNGGVPFCCDLYFGDTWQERIDPKDLGTALSEVSFHERIRKVIQLYVKGLEVLYERSPRPNVVLCCIPQEVIDLCTVKVTSGGVVKRRKMSAAEKSAWDAVKAGQGFLFPEMDPTLGVEDEVQGHQNLRRGLKAEAMRFEMPTQLVWPRTLKTIDEEPKTGTQASQDRATRAWNFITALYHKAGGSPWRLADVDQDTCFIGVAFYRDLAEGNPRIRTAMAQAFMSSGDGYVLRGNSFEWDESRQGKSPHLNAAGAASLMRDVIELYKRQNRGNLPRRMVVHKTSRFWNEELAGFRQACEVVRETDFVALGWRGIQFYRPGSYPPLRGTYVKLSTTNLLLYTVGYVPYLRTYPGARVPQPIEILEHHGDSPWELVLREVLALTKLNWNTSAFACSEPITVAFSRRVGQVLAELGPRQPLRGEYRFFM